MSTDPNTPTALTSFPNAHEAAAVVAALADHGIQASTTGSFTAGFLAEAPGRVSIVVRNSDHSAAKKLLEEFEVGEVEVDWSQVDVGEPEDS